MEGCLHKVIADVCFTVECLLIVLECLLNYEEWPWLMWLTGVSDSLGTKGSLVLFPARAHARVEGQIPSGGSEGAKGATTHCLSPSLPLSPSLLK